MDYLPSDFANNVTPVSNQRQYVTYGSIPPLQNASRERVGNAFEEMHAAHSNVSSGNKHATRAKAALLQNVQNLMERQSQKDEPSYSFFGHDEYYVPSRAQFVDETRDGSDGVPITALDEADTFGTDELKSMILCGKPGSGKTETLKNILLRLSYRPDVLIFITKTQESVPFFESLTPRQYVLGDVTTDMMLDLLDALESHKANTGQHCAVAVVIDDVLTSATTKRSYQPWLDEYIKRGHRAGIMLIVAVHTAKDIWGGGAEAIKIRMQLGTMEFDPAGVTDFWHIFGRGLFPNFKVFEEYHKKIVTSKGLPFIFQEIKGQTVANYWNPPMVDIGYTLGHRDSYIATYVISRPIRRYEVVVDADGNETAYWPYCGESSVVVSAGPDLSVLGKQMTGEWKEAEKTTYFAKPAAKKTATRRR